MFNNLKEKLGFKTSTKHFEDSKSHFEACAAEGKEAVTSVINSATSVAKTAFSAAPGASFFDYTAGKIVTSYAATFGGAMLPKTAGMVLKSAFSALVEHPVTIFYACVGLSIILLAGSAPIEAASEAASAATHTATAVKEGALGASDLAQAGFASLLESAEMLEDGYSCLAGKGIDFTDIADFTLV